jgi:hypothetical protein
MRLNHPAHYCCLLIVVLTMLWPGDNHWFGDDIDLIRFATQANDQHRLVSAGLGGSYGYPYGPIPSQIYQVLCLISRNPIVLTRLHAALFGGGTALALFYLASVLGMSPWLVPLMLLGPYFWYYTRLLWDNTFAIPIGTLLLASYGDYLRKPTLVKFYIWVICGLTLPFIHLMTLPLAGAVGLHAMVVQRREFLRRWIGLLIIAGCIAITCGAYINRVLHQVIDSPRLMENDYPKLSRPAAFAYPLLSGRLFSAHSFLDFHGPEYGIERDPLPVLAQRVSTVAYGFFWLGLLVALTRLGQKNTILKICLAALALQSLMDGYLRIPPFPHYYCGTWAAIVVVLWIGIDWLKNTKLQRPVAVIYAMSMVIATIAFAIDIHRNCGGKVWYGPSMQAQLDPAGSSKP